MTDQTDQTDQTGQTGQTGQSYRQVSSYLKAAGEEVTQLLDMLSEGLALEAQVRRDAAHRASTAASTAASTHEATPGSASSNGTWETFGPEAGEPR